MGLWAVLTRSHGSARVGVPVMVYVDGVERPDPARRGRRDAFRCDGPHHVYVQFEGGRPYDPDDPDHPYDWITWVICIARDKPGDFDDPNGSGGAGDVNGNRNGSGGENGSGDNGGSSGADDPNGSGGRRARAARLVLRRRRFTERWPARGLSGTDAADSKANGHRMVALGRTGDNAALPWTVAMVAASYRDASGPAQPSPSETSALSARYSFLVAPRKSRIGLSAECTVHKRRVLRDLPPNPPVVRCWATGFSIKHTHMFDLWNASLRVCFLRCEGNGHMTSV